MDKLKKLIWCFLVILVGMSVPTVFGNYLTNGDFASDITGWALLHDEDPNMVVEHDAGEGSGSAKLSILPIPVGFGSGEHHFYQAFPVTAGKMYQVTGQWKGDLNSGAGAGARGTVQVQTSFGTIATAGSTTDWDTQYMKRYDGDTPDDVMNIESSGTWDWEEIADSPQDGDGDADEGATVGFEVPVLGTGQHFMFVGFNINIGDTDEIEAGDIEVWIDDLAVKACQDPTGDLDGDCKVTLSDLAIVAADWMKCNLDPVSACPL